MAPHVQLIVDVPGELPFRGSVAITNKYVRQSLETAGMQVEVVSVERQNSWPEMLIPLREAAVVARLGRASADLKIFVDRTLSAAAPEPRAPERNAIFFNGLAFGPQIYLQSGCVSGYCTNSRYLMDSLLTLLLFPRDADFDVAIREWPAPGPVIANVPLPAPCLEYPDGYASPGAMLTSVHRDVLRRDRLVLGHALRPGKAEPFSTAAIMVHLDGLCRDYGLEGSRVFIDDVSYRNIGAVQHLLPVPFDVERYFEPLPLIQNTELYELIRHSHFGLCYDRCPESFGLYPLDSVFCGVPVFTNGVGNLRHLLPEGHGIHVFDPPGLVHGSPEDRFAACHDVARSIVDSIVSGSGRRACDAGVTFMRERYTPDQFSIGFRKFVEACLQPSLAEPADVSAMRLALSPFVRRWCPADGRVISDYRSLRLSPAACELMGLCLGRRVADLARELDRPSRNAIVRLYAEGILTFAVPCGDLLRPTPTVCSSNPNRGSD